RLTDQIDRVLLAIALAEFAVHEATETLGHLADPAGLAVFAVGDDVDADIGLLLDDTRNFFAQDLAIARLVMRLAIVARGEDVADRRRRHEAADMGGQNPVRAAFHGV